MKTIISKDRAQTICNNWHGGQWSALYQFSSSKQWEQSNALKYVWEVMQDLQQEFFATYPQILSKKDTKELEQLRDFFLYKAKENETPIRLVKHSLYGYQYPLLDIGDSAKMLNVDNYFLPI